VGCIYQIVQMGPNPNPSLGPWYPLWHFPV